MLQQSHPSPVRASQLETSPPGVWRYASLLPEADSEDLVTLGEGGTPLLHARRLGQELGLARLMIKDESRNPTGSFIDRGSTVLVSLAKQRGVNECICVTTGNLGASLAAYCAKAGITARIRIHPSTDREKLYQMLAYGAKIEGPPSDVGESSKVGRVLPVTARNPYLLEGEKTTCFEIVQELGWREPDAIVLPVGTGGHLSMTWLAVRQLRELRLTKEGTCRLFGVRFSPSQARPPRESTRSRDEVSSTELEDSEPFFRKEVKRAIDDSSGLSVSTTIDEAMKATGLLARTEGIFAEPASASAVACISSAVRRGLLARDDLVVCVITGAGLKDTKAISRIARAARRVEVRGDVGLARMRLGETKLELLWSLQGRPGYGYDLWKSLTASRKMSTASVYQHLAELEGYGLARRSGPTFAGGRERVLYQITSKGNDLLRIAGELEGKR